MPPFSKLLESPKLSLLLTFFVTVKLWCKWWIKLFHYTRKKTVASPCQITPFHPQQQQQQQQQHTHIILPSLASAAVYIYFFNSRLYVHICHRVFKIVLRGGGDREFCREGECFHQVVGTWGGMILTIWTFLKA